MDTGEFLFHGWSHAEPMPRVHRLDMGSYPDGMPLANMPRLDYVSRILLRPKSLASFMAAMFWVDAYTERSNAVPELILPCVPGARQDRLNETGDYLFTAKSVAREVNARDFPRVTVVDPHSDVTPALLDRCHVVHADQCVSPPTGKYTAVISPDGGAEKRAGAVARKLDVPLIHAWKTRDVATGKISGFGAEDQSWLTDGSRVLVVDDICDAGGTFLGLVNHLHRLQEDSKHTYDRVIYDLYVTHGLFTAGTKVLLAKFAHVYCTDSTIGDRPGVIEVPICQKILEGYDP